MEELKTALLKRAADKDGKKVITCLEANNLAKEMTLDPKEVGKTATLLKIKIIACQLGCFP